MLTDYEMMCGNNLLFQILPSGPEESVDIIITAENANPEEDGNNSKHNCNCKLKLDKSYQVEKHVFVPLSLKQQAEF